jgi:hypothetical protein
MQNHREENNNMLRIYAKNPHYLEWNGQPCLLIGSTEHYGALMNTAFDDTAYLQAIASAGLNYTRLFTGVYLEKFGQHHIMNNTLAPERSSFICPWKQEPGGRYDLAAFNPLYMQRLKNFLARAAQGGVMVELTLFCFFYSEEFWRESPMHPANTVQGVGPTHPDGFFSLQDKALLAYQEDLVRWLVTELNGFGNLVVEICNEPYSHHDHSAYLPWQAHMAGQIQTLERGLTNQHIIAQNFQNRTIRIEKLHPAVSLINFHYALPEAAQMNAHLNRPMIDDETGFLGQLEQPYRQEAWSFMLAGGAGLNHLDYSFTCQHPRGDAAIEGRTPGYGSASLRRQFAFLRNSLEAAAVWEMQPLNEMFSRSPARLAPLVMGRPGQRYLVYLRDVQAGELCSIGLPRGGFTITHIDPASGNQVAQETVVGVSGHSELRFANAAPDILLDITPRGEGARL